jgi:Rod binding domain-containing protein
MSDVTSTPMLPPNASANTLLAKPPIRELNASDMRDAEDSTKFDKVFKDYEAVYLSEMLSHMYAGIEVDPMFGGGAGEATMRSLLINEYGKKMSEAGGIGLADAMKRQMLAAQEQVALAQQAATTPEIKE